MSHSSMYFSGALGALLLTGGAHATDTDNAPSAADAPSAPTSAAPAGSSSSGTLQTVVVTAQRFNAERATIETQTGASTYTIDQSAIAAAPGGDNLLMNQVLLQAPDVAQDSFGQFHVRGDHNDLQYRLNGIILPEGISVFGQTLSPRLIESLKLITGALPAEYGLRTAGIVDLTTKSGLLQPGGEVSVYGGSHGTFEPSFDYGGSEGNASYFVIGDVLRSDLGIESPDGSSNPIHDHTTQYHAFGYFDDILGSSDRLSLILGASSERFQIPNQDGLQPTLGLTVEGQTNFPSQDLDENQRELASYAILTWQHSQESLNWQSGLTARYTSLTFEPDPIGDLLYDGIGQYAFKRDVAVGWQTDASYALNDSHTVRAGFYLQHDDSSSPTISLVLPVDNTGVQTSQIPVSIADNSDQTQWIQSLYLQDEWKLGAGLTVNYGLRFDHFTAYTSGSQLSPRVNVVWETGIGTTLHAGYSRYFTPPPFELIGSESISKFINTTAQPAVVLDDAPKAERADYFDVGVQQQLFDKSLTLGVDSYYKRATHLIDEGQFGAPIILTPFNYQHGLVEGIELTANYAYHDFSAYGNVAFQSAKGRQIETAQFNFAPDDLAYISDHWIHLDHEQRVSASGGVSYLWKGTRASLDMLMGTGLRADLPLGDGSSIPNGAHLPTYVQWNLGLSHDFHLIDKRATTLRFDVINLTDKVYQIRNGTGVGVGAPQFGPRLGFFGGISQAL